MTVEIALYDPLRKYTMDGTVDLDTDVLKLALLDSGYNPQPSAAAWVAATSYALGTIIVVGGMFYEATVAGVSSGSQPVFPTTRGATLTENTVTWYCWAYSPPSAHAIFADVSAHEIVAAGYTAGGAALTGAAVTVAGRSATFSADSVSWAAILCTVRYAVLYKEGTANGVVNPLIAYLLLDNLNIDVVVPVAALFTIEWTADGIFTTQ